MRKLYWIAFAIFLFVTSCTKIDSTNIGSGLIPTIDGVNTFDTTLTVFTNSLIDPIGDSVKVYKSDDHVVGVINNDPLFGKTTAKAFFELKPTSYPYSTSTTTTPSAVADSAVLILSYKGVYGDTTINQDWEVRELTETIQGDSAYSVSSSFATGASIGEKNIDIRSLNDSVNYGFENAINQIRIKLSLSFAKRLIEGYQPANEYKNDTTFRQSFKGFVVQPKSTSAGNALIRFNLLDTNTKLALFYNYKKADTSTTRDNVVSYFRFSTGLSSTVSGSANNIKRQFSPSQFSSFATSGNDSVVFIQSSPGTFATIKIPGLSGFPNAIIHRAELLTFQAPEPTNLNTILTPPRYLLLNSYDSTSKVKTNVPNDFIVSSSGMNLETFGGYLRQINVDGVGVVNNYNFDLSRYVQGIVTRKDANKTLRLYAPANDSLKYSDPYPSTAASSIFYFTPGIANEIANGRVRLGGGGMFRNAPLRMRLRIIYSRI